MHDVTEDVSALSHHGLIERGRRLRVLGIEDQAFLADQAPTILAEVWANWRKDDQLPLKISHDQILVRLPQSSFANITILIEQCHELKVSSAHHLAVEHPGVVQLRLCNQTIHFVLEPSVHKA